MRSRGVANGPARDVHRSRSERREDVRRQRHDRTEESRDWEFLGPTCQIRCIDLGIAVGSAAKLASMNNVDTRCQTRVAAAARHPGIIHSDLAVALSMSVSHKNIFFDKKIPSIDFEAVPTS